jgi:hypothetical protein
MTRTEPQRDPIGEHPLSLPYERRQWRLNSLWLQLVRFREGQISEPSRHLFVIEDHASVRDALNGLMGFFAISQREQAGQRSISTSQVEHDD